MYMYVILPVGQATEYSVLRTYIILADKLSFVLGKHLTIETIHPQLILNGLPFVDKLLHKLSHLSDHNN